MVPLETRALWECCGRGMAVGETGTVDVTQLLAWRHNWMMEPFCIMLGRFDLESWWRGQRLFGVIHLGMENAGSKVSVRGWDEGTLGLWEGGWFWMTMEVVKYLRVSGGCDSSEARGRWSLKRKGDIWSLDMTLSNRERSCWASVLEAVSSNLSEF